MDLSVQVHCHVLYAWKIHTKETLFFHYHIKQNEEITWGFFNKSSRK